MNSKDHDDLILLDDAHGNANDECQVIRKTKYDKDEQSNTRTH